MRLVWMGCLLEKLGLSILATGAEEDDNDDLGVAAFD
jgi:hypothetical protein